MVEIGDPAPDFTLRDVQGKDVSLRSLRKRGKVLLVFYRGSWCPFCNTQIASLERDRERFEERGVQLVGISTDSVQGAQRMQAKSKARFPLLLDPEASVIDAYEVRRRKREFKDMPALVHRQKTYAIPSLFLVDEEGRVRYRYVGKSFTDRPANEEVIEVLEGSIDGKAPLAPAQRSA